MQKIPIFKNIEYDIENDTFLKGTPLPLFIRYLKRIFTNKNKFEEGFITPFKEGLIQLERVDRLYQIDMILAYFEQAKPFSYIEAFQLEDQTFRALVFGSINVEEMLNYLGNKRISVDGKPVKHRVYKQDGSYTMREYDVVYELYEIDCTKLKINEKNYCVKCWCTTTNKEHWLWVEKEYALKGPLEAIASTVRVYENMIPYIKTIKRQGDVFLFEMTEKIIPSGKIVPLTAEKYFNLLVAQS